MEEFFKKTAGGDLVPNAAGGGASLEGEQDLVLADGVKLGEISAEAGPREVIKTLQAKLDGSGVQKLDSPRPTAGGFLPGTKVNSAGDTEEGLAFRLGNQAGAKRRKGGKGMGIEKLRSGGKIGRVLVVAGVLSYGFHVVAKIVSRKLASRELGHLPRRKRIRRIRYAAREIPKAARIRGIANPTRRAKHSGNV